MPYPYNGFRRTATSARGYRATGYRRRGGYAPGNRGVSRYNTTGRRATSFVQPYGKSTGWRGYGKYNHSFIGARGSRSGVFSLAAKGTGKFNNRHNRKARSARRVYTKKDYSVLRSFRGTHGHMFKRKGYTHSKHGGKRSSSKAHTTVARETFFVAGGRKPSPEFKARVEESLSNPVTFTFATGNVVIGEQKSKDYATGHYFQPHRIGTIGSPAITPTPFTEQCIYLYDYFTVASMFGTLYTNIGTVQDTLRQIIRVSGHMDYYLKNMATEPVFVECTRWSVKKMPSVDLASMPGSTASPVYTGNIANFIGMGIFLKSGDGGTTNALNTKMDDLEIPIRELPLINEFFDTKTFIVRIGVGQQKHFKVGRKLLAIDTLENFVSNASLPGFASDTSTWCNAFIPGACGFIFRVRGNPDIVDTNPVSEYTSIAYSRPSMVLTTKVSYTVYDWLQQPEREDHFFFSDSGMQAGAVNGDLNTVIPGLAAPVHPSEATA